MNNMFTKQTLVAAMAIAAVSAQAQQPTTPPVFTIDPAECGVIFAADQDTYFETLKDGQGNSADSWAPVTWGQQCIISADEAGDGAALRIDNFDFMPLQFKSTLSLTDYNRIHFDFWVSSDLPLDITFQNWWPGEKYTTPIYDLKAGQWNSIDIALDDPTYFQWSEVKNGITSHPVNVIKLGGEAAEAKQKPNGETIYMTNVIAYNVQNDDAAINSITTTAKSTTRYNATGQQVSADYKGLVISNGKKFFNR